jgi:hypothetical protein
MRWLHANNTIHGHLTRQSISIDHERRSHIGCVDWSSGHYGLDDRGEPISFKGAFYDFGVHSFSLRWTLSPAFLDLLDAIVSPDPSDRPTFDEIVEFFESEFPDEIETYVEYELAPGFRHKIQPDRLQELGAAISDLPFVDQCARVLAFFEIPHADSRISRRDDFIQSLNRLSYLAPNTSIIALTPDSRRTCFQKVVPPRSGTPLSSGKVGSVVMDGEFAVKKVPVRWTVYGKGEHASPCETNTLIVAVLRGSFSRRVENRPEGSQRRICDCDGTSGGCRCLGGSLRTSTTSGIFDIPLPVNLWTGYFCF